MLLARVLLELVAFLENLRYEFPYFTNNLGIQIQLIVQETLHPLQNKYLAPIQPN